MVRHHSGSCDCERCHPSADVLHFLERHHSRKPASPDTLYSRRKRQERRVAEELRRWSQQCSQLDFTGSQTPRELRHSPEAQTVVRNILRRFKQSQGKFFTHLEIQVILFWHMCQAMDGESIDAALAMMLTGVLTPYAKNTVLQTRATEMLSGARDQIDRGRAEGYHEMVRLLAANGADLRMNEALVHRTMFHFDSRSNIAIAQNPRPPISSSSSPSRETSNEGSVYAAQGLDLMDRACSISPSTSPSRERPKDEFLETRQSLVILESSPAPQDEMEIEETDARLEQLQQENDLLTERVHYLEDERAQMQEHWEVMERKLNESEAENQRLRSVLEASLQIFTEPWEALKDKLET